MDGNHMKRAKLARRTPKPIASKRPARKPAKPARPATARVAAILAELHQLYPEAECALSHKSAWELLVATILSAQCTDDRVNKVTPNLFTRYPTIADLARAVPRDLEGVIKSTGFFRNKTKNLIGAAKTLTEKFSAAVPRTMDELLELPGVARKTANVLLGTWFKQNEGVVVDTHIGRLAHRLGLTWRSKNDKDAVKIEQDLMEVLPRNEWTFVGHALIWHGRKVCTARKPNCAECTLAKNCPSAFLFDGKPATRQRRAATAASTVG